MGRLGFRTGAVIAIAGCLACSGAGGTGGTDDAPGVDVSAPDEGPAPFDADPVPVDVAPDLPPEVPLDAGGGDDPGPGCLPGDCDDGNPCTADRCVDGECTHVCECDAPCRTDADCPVTACDIEPRCRFLGGAEDCVATACSYTARDCDDGSWCTVDRCDPATGCVHEWRYCPPPCTADGDCAEGEACRDDATLSRACDPGIDADPASGHPTCRCVVPADCFGDPDCDDGNPCTTDRCRPAGQGGRCVNDTLPCPAGSDPCRVGQCDPATGRCRSVPGPDGVPCDDGRFCTTGDACLEGACAGGPRDCSDLDAACVTGRCDEDVGECVGDVHPDDSPCEDDDVCITGDYCLGGTCRPGCEGSYCHPGASMVCVCLYPWNDCGDDGNRCNGTLWLCNWDEQLCELQDEPVVCPPPDAPCRRSACVPATGKCEEADAPDGTACDDGDPCTVEDRCLAGTCRPGPAAEGCR